MMVSWGLEGGGMERVGVVECDMEVLRGRSWWACVTRALNTTQVSTRRTEQAGRNPCYISILNIIQGEVDPTQVTLPPSLSCRCSAQPQSRP
eukprot:1175815-Rhodomonas_salina.2